MIRGLNAIYTQVDIPKTDAEKYSFAGYILAWCEITHTHHTGVTSTFPDLT